MPANPLSEQIEVDDAVLARTRLGLHQLAEQALASDRFRHDGRIGLRPCPGGFGTPWVIVDGAKRCSRIEGTEIVLIVGDERTAAPITTVRAAAELLGVEPGPPPSYRSELPFEPDAPLELDAHAVSVVAAWFAFGADSLERFMAGHHEIEGAATGPILWPEHFDLAVTIPGEERGEVVLGVSPGDEVDPEPYAYVAWQGVERDDAGVATDSWWNRPWGRAVPATEIGVVDDLVAVFDDGFRRSR